MPAGTKFKNANAEANRRRVALEKARRHARAVLGCEHCGASKEEIRGEQHRLRDEMYARLARRTTNETAAAPTATAS